MASPQTKRKYSTPFDDGSLSDSSASNEGEKTIPFLRRLRDMLVENQNVISFAAGSVDLNTLGRIVVHDRVQVEAKVLPRYFNHSSFASLRRQLNYFSFVRLGKGRQRESAYINENVVKLDDILHLKRRSTTNGARVEAAQEKLFADLATAEKQRKNEMSSKAPVLDLSSTQTSGRKHKELTNLSQKRQRQNNGAGPATVSPRSLSPIQNNCISEDENSLPYGKKYIALDLTKPAADFDVLEGCRDLLRLSSKQWH